jgi:hypothetical protein
MNDIDRDAEIARLSVAVATLTGRLNRLSDNGLRGMETGDSLSPNRILMREIDTVPTAVTDGCWLYCVDNGSGKTKLMALFASGAAQQVAIQP